MSGFQAFCSFVELCKTKLTPLDVSVLLEEDAKPDSGAFMVLQDGPEEQLSRWLVTRICQARLFVPASAERTSQIEMGETLDKVMDALRDLGSPEKRNYKSDGTSVVTGTYQVQVTEVSPELSNDPKVSQRIITFELTTNARAQK
jgi:hypothetical protein